MNNVIEQMLFKYEINNTNDEINALKEIIQEIILTGLSRGHFFDVAAFYGGTALRIFYNLARFSEDLDFALTIDNQNFQLNSYFSYIENELKAYGLNLEVSTKIKKFDSNITTAFVSGDINPPKGATYEYKYKLLPSPHQIKLYDMSSLFASKIHAILCRNWGSRVKGRDLYDYVFFLANHTTVNIELIKNKLIASNYIHVNSSFDIQALKELLIQKFEKIDYKEAKADVLPFIKDVNSLDLWDKDFFIQITQELN